MRVADIPAGGGQAAGQFNLAAQGDRWVLTMERRIRADADTLWRCLTEPESLSRWAPFAPDRPLSGTGAVRFSAAHMEDADARAGVILEVQPGHRLAFQWGPDILTWTVAASGGDMRLTLGHQFSDQGQAPAYAAGWQLCLKGLAELAEGGNPPVMVGEQALQHGWLDWYVWYARYWQMDPF